jgi:hypothetical protein
MTKRSLTAKSYALQTTQERKGRCSTHRRGDRLDYSGDVATSTEDITTFKILINSTLYTKDAAMMMMDIKSYYLGTPLPRFEYMKSCYHDSPRKSSSTTSTIQPSMVGFTLKFEKACTV